MTDDDGEDQPPMTQPKGKTMSDGEIVKYARRLQRLHEKAQTVLEAMEGSGHPNAGAAATDLRDQCFGLAWPEHVIRHYIDPEKWEVDATGIHHKGRK
jgi:hypothetical protein